ncbi:hypothetical protein AVEN_205332-1 [Araneus ventricosus]|uniref:Uncharacterized protein n=1 Tax=Araneus ventricosus TaxID=182803 RepID=A0A4Y2LNX8_ARAVE|nr:hypothetical protein AVEN_205332-1 [Araneus ventricosus]
MQYIKLAGCHTLIEQGKRPWIKYQTSLQNPAFWVLKNMRATSFLKRCQNTMHLELPGTLNLACPDSRKLDSIQRLFQLYLLLGQPHCSPVVTSAPAPPPSAKGNMRCILSKTIHPTFSLHCSFSLELRRQKRGSQELSQLLYLVNSAEQRGKRNCHDIWVQASQWDGIRAEILFHRIYRTGTFPSTPSSLPVLELAAFSYLEMCHAQKMSDFTLSQTPIDNSIAVVENISHRQPQDRRL